MGLVPTAKDIEDMPISINDLKGLFTFLDEKSISGFECNHTFKLTESYLSKNNLNKEKILLWLRENGAGCDCEVMLNVAENWSEIVGYEGIDDNDINCTNVSRYKKPWWKIW